jgi:hypothetical protein
LLHGVKVVDGERVGVGIADMGRASQISLVPMAWIWFSTYWRPVMPMVTTRMSDAVPITMPSAVRMNRTLLLQKVS